MSTILKFPSKFLIIFLLLTPFPLWSQETLLAIGQIDDIGSNYITITDSRFEILSTVKVFLLDNKSGELADLKIGDFVKLSLLKMDNIKYVDTINILSEP